MSSPPPTRREQIVAAARELYETNGLENTTVKDIAEEVGVARSLFYHYFPNKDAVTEAVLDDYVNDFVQMLGFWNDERKRFDVRGALHSAIHVLRQGVFDSDPFRKDLASVENAGLYLKFYEKTAEALATYINKTTVREYHLFHKRHVVYTYETLYVLISGLVLFLRRYPNTSDEVLEEMVAQALQLDLDGSARL